jgi:hypothetical protein
MKNTTHGFQSIRDVERAFYLSVEIGKHLCSKGRDGLDTVLLASGFISASVLGRGLRQKDLESRGR